MVKNQNRIYGNWIIIAKKGTEEKFYQWKHDELVSKKEDATGYDTKVNANWAIDALQKGNTFPEYEYTTILDKPKP